MNTKFAKNILLEKDFGKKIKIINDNKKELEIFFDNTIMYKSFIAKMFIEAMELDVDQNIVVTAMMLCGCKKINNAQDISKIESYAKKSANYLATLGFPKEFCILCEQHNRYSNNYPRKKESDILELVDQFGGMLLDRPERVAFPIEEALLLLENRNLKNCNNVYLKEFKEFVNMAKEINI